MTDQWDSEGGLIPRDPEPFTYVIQVETDSTVLGVGWTTVKSGLTMDEASVTLESFRRVNPKRTFRLIPTDWVDGISHG